MQSNTNKSIIRQQIPFPDAGKEVVILVNEGVTLDFLFDPVDVSFELYKKNVIMTFENGGSVVLSNIATVDNPPDFPFVRLQDGSLLSQEAFIEAATGLSNIITEGGLVFK